MAHTVLAFEPITFPVRRETPMSAGRPKNRDSSNHPDTDALDFFTEFPALVAFARGAKIPEGFGYLSDEGKPLAGRGAELWITCRMTHIFSLAHLLGIPGAAELAAHGVAALAGPFRDHTNGGWYSQIGEAPEGTGIAATDPAKAAYAHSFVVLAAASAVAAGVTGGETLLRAALEDQDEHWWEEEFRRVRESWDETFTNSEAYRGINANMHTVEAYLAAADITEDPKWRARAVDILRFVAEQAAPFAGRVPEHYDENWNLLPDYNAANPADPFRPFGVTPGHGFEWARLMLHARQSIERAGGAPEPWMLPSAISLYERAAADGWAADGAPGFVYTTDFSGEPVVRERMHWVLAEAIGAGRVLQQVLETEDPPAAVPVREKLSGQLDEWGAYANKYMRQGPGQWHHELNPNNEPSAITWAGKPDVYHVGQMLLLEHLPPSRSFAAALRDPLIAEPLRVGLQQGSSPSQE